MSDEEELHDPDLPRGYLSPSSVGMFLKCPRQFAFRYCDGLTAPPGVALVEGSSYHEVLQIDNRGAMVRGEHMDADSMMDVFRDTFGEKKREIGDWEGEDENKILNRATEVVKRCHQQQQSVHDVKRVEHQFRALMGGVPVLGVIDLEASVEDGVNRVIDYKFSNRKLNDDDLLDHFQLGTYVRATGVPNVAIIRNERKKTGKLQVVKNKIPKVKLNIIDDTVANVAVGIKAGCFPMTDAGNWWCSEKWCGYWSRCRGKKATPRRVIKKKK